MTRKVRKRGKKRGEKKKHTVPEVFKEVSHPYSGGASEEAAAGTRTQKVGAKENNRPDQSQQPPRPPPPVCGALISRDSKMTEKLIDLLSNPP